MYDGTDIALVVGGLLSAGATGLSLVFGLMVLAWFVFRKPRNELGAASLAGRLAVFFFVTALLCGLSIASGLAVYDLFEHQRGQPNPPSHVLAVAIASAWGPLVAVLFGSYWLRRKKRVGAGPS